MMSEQDQEIPKLLTTEDIAEKLQVDARTVVGYISRGELPAITLAGSYRVYPADLKNFLDQRYKQPLKKRRSKKE